MERIKVHDYSGRGGGLLSHSAAGREGVEVLLLHKVDRYYRLTELAFNVKLTLYRCY